MRCHHPTSSLEATEATQRVLSYSRCHVQQSAVDHACTPTSTPAICKTRTERLRRRRFIVVVLCAGRGLALALLLRRRLRLGISRRRRLCRAGAPRPAAADQLHRLACSQTTRVYDTGLCCSFTWQCICRLERCCGMHGRLWRGAADTKLPASRLDAWHWRLCQHFWQIQDAKRAMTGSHSEAVAGRCRRKAHQGACP